MLAGLPPPPSGPIHPATTRILRFHVRLRSPSPMSHSLIPFRTYVAAAVLSLVINVGAVGTFATFRVPATSRPSADLGSPAAMVLSDLAPLPLPPPPPKTSATKPAPVPQPPLAEPPAPKPLPEPPRIRLGNPDAKDSDSPVWLGVSEDPGAPRAPLALVDQADFKPGQPGTPSPTAPGQQRPQRPTLASQSLDSSPSNPSVPAPEVTRKPQPPALPLTSPPSDPAQARQAAPLDPLLDPFAAALEVSRADDLSQTLPPKEASLSFDQSTPLDQPQPRPEVDSDTHAAISPRQPPVQPSAPQDSTNQGNGADRESDAFAKDQPVNVRPGQPLAGKGLAIRTVAPRWTTATKNLFRFQNPVVRVKFGRQGKVLHAAFVPGRDAGHPDVSGPVLDAIYRWTARGEELASLSAADPHAGVVIEFRILLR
jgi:hypothetical protein